MTGQAEQRKELFVNQIVKEDYRTASVFKRHGIDFCCGGKMTLTDACKLRNANLAVVKAELAQAVETLPVTDDFDSWSLDRLANYIIEVHHTYIKETIPQLVQYATRIDLVHGKRNPELTSLKNHVDQLAEELLSHMRKEEMILFPMVIDLVQAPEEEATTFNSRFGALQSAVRVMEAEHDDAGSLMQQIREETNNFTPPSNACNTWRVTYGMLGEFESDLFQHIHLENNILFPKALAMEPAVVES